MSLTLLLHCNDISTTRSFYRDVLGFRVTDTAQDTLTAECFGARLVFTASDLWQSTPFCSGTIYFEVEDLETLYASVTGNPNISWALQDMPYGSREFGIKDCNGYFLAFRQKKSDGEPHD